MKTALTDRLLIRHPIIQAPMGTCSGPELAAAVSNAGALGSIAVWPFSPERAAQLVSDAIARTDKPFSVNIRADLGQHEHIRATLHGGATIVHLFWGDPTPHAGTVRSAGAKLLCTVASEDEAKQALDAGADVLVAQGWEAGGHVRGNTSTLALVPAIVDLAASVPVVAAGGIVDGRGLAAVLALGASGALMGSRFVASEESSAHPDYKRAIVAARHADTILATHLFDIGWPDAPHRVLRNSTVRLWEEAGSPSSGPRPGENDTIATRPDGRSVPRYAVSTPLVGMTGELEAMALYAGQGVQGITAVLPAATIVETTIRQAAAALSRCEA
jgi:NAD(P)H-dependent flavin oxidoreductase YrpB (nitropropane dioxygenase family)